ncbi:MULTISPECIES: GNAT family N-acetyltransferase [unclassified Rathayibacter]|uniref:GNAT family N-acetyltransferase n=1 Tax=unclassified Rathayibacter TaxID=2609250 RepID=UPI00188AABAD|nr:MULTISPECIES: GNAT family protein [unclassified Rathayibacter]MBF4461421.1 GNAT family N-acetyltransferase [Rathayibacter sp. VKM Ac-2879]MBF4502832.1 GNAT family N-acetyltransferase [Rathayibacter sp. VKM Ac-2878]
MSTPLRLPFDAEPLRREPLETERLLLRPLSFADADDHARYQGDAEAVRYLRWPVRTPEESRAHLRVRLPSTRLAADGDVVVLAIVAREGALAGRVIGDLTLIASSLAHASVEVGWVVHPEAQGRGLASEAARALIALAFDELGAHRVVAQLDARNAASARLCERLGMRLEAHHLDDEFCKGEWTSTLVYALLAREYRAR